MFRDESSKVIQKAHAQWGVLEASPSAVSRAPTSFDTPSSTSPIHISPSSFHGRVATNQPVAVSGAVDITLAVGPTLDEQGIQFYMNRYLGHPGGSQSTSGVNAAKLLFDPVIQDVMAATGLAALSNLRGNAEMGTMARQKYVAALQRTGTRIRSPHMLDIELALKSVVMLAVFEVRVGFVIWKP